MLSRLGYRFVDLRLPHTFTRLTFSVQAANFETKTSGFTVFGRMMATEGPTALFKGLVPKLLMTGPKLVFSFWLAQTLIPAFGKVM